MFKSLGDNKTIQLAFLGCGEITKDHTKYARQADSTIQLSYASRSLKKATEYKIRCKGKYAFDGYESAINSKYIDVIMINTPPDSHFELTKMALDAGKHVIVEKPPFFKSTDFDILGNLADENKLQLLVAENYYYKPLRLKIKKLLDEKLIGDPLYLNISATKKQISSGDWRELKEITGFGSLFEGGIHWINFMNNLGYTMTDIQGFLPKPTQELERSSQVSIKTKNGPILNLFYSWEADTIFRGYRISRIYGREGSITFETNGNFIFVRGRKTKLIFPGFKHLGGYALMFGDFFRALRLGQEANFTWRMAQRDLEVIEKAYATAEAWNLDKDQGLGTEI